MGRGLSQLSCEIKILKNKGVKNIVIAAGYATRLGDLTRNFPKPLLKIGENTILGRMLDDIDRISKTGRRICTIASRLPLWMMEQRLTKLVLELCAT